MNSCEDFGASLLCWCHFLLRGQKVTKFLLILIFPESHKCQAYLRIHVRRHSRRDGAISTRDPAVRSGVCVCVCVSVCVCAWIEKSQLVAVWLMQHNISHWSQNKTKNSLILQRIFMSFPPRRGRGDFRGDNQKKERVEHFETLKEPCQGCRREFCSKRRSGVCQSV